MFWVDGVIPAAFTMFAAKVSREKRIPFDVAVDPFYSEKNMARLRESIAQMEATGGTIHEVSKGCCNTDI